MNTEMRASEAVAEFLAEHKEAVGYLLPSVGSREVRPVMVRAVNGQLYKKTDDAGAEVVADIDESMEIRLFDECVELSWTSVQGSGVGRRVVRDEATAIARHLFPIETRPGEPKRSRKLLWGQISAPLDAGWARLSDARVGSFWAPITVGEAPGRTTTEAHEAGCLYFLKAAEVDASDPHGDEPWYVAFQTQEYLAEDEHGNHFVADERYLGIEALPECRLTVPTIAKGEE